MQELREVLRETREDREREQRASFARIASTFEAGENVIRKFERGETAPRFDRVDDLVAAYAEIDGTASPLDLWQRAIDRAREAEAKLKRGITSPDADARDEEELPPAPGREARRRGKRGGRAASG